ncbi:MAG: methyltransferase domain-containing protein [Firmicutes bacterium]|nr:methyltransferase domain-containing protein [Bacillota bacterium]
MNGLIQTAVTISHRLLALSVQKGDTVIDATAGKGRDTCFLAELVGETGQVWAFDIQEEACNYTRAALVKAGYTARVQVFCDDHANLAAYNIAPAAAAIFNLGWLPGSDHTVVSGAGIVSAMKAVLDKLKIGGVLIAVAYPGHSRGATEYDTVLKWISSLPQKQARCLQISFPAHVRAPLVLLIEKQ